MQLKALTKVRKFTRRDRFVTALLAITGSQLMSWPELKKISGILFVFLV